MFSVVGDMVEVGENKVAKLFPPGTPRADIERELETTLLMKRYGLETPFVRGLVEHDGREGIAFDKVLGPTYTQWMVEHPALLGRLTDYFAHEHHEVHMHRVTELPRLKEVVAARLAATEALDGEEREQLLKKLSRARDGDWLCHMNYVPDNIIMSLDGPVVFNWGSAVRGDYLADVAMTSLLLEQWTPALNEGDAAPQFRDFFRFGYVNEYMKISGRMNDDLIVWTDILRPTLSAP
jgi:hypothetical protein